MGNENVEKRIKELILILNKANDAYYNDDREVMSNFEYDKLYDELVDLENEYNIYFTDSPTQNVGYKVAESLEKVRHEKPMLSLDKTKEREALREFLGDKEGVLSYKLDGLTIVLTYEKGRLVRGVTRGNGEVGEDVTNNIMTFLNVPQKIDYDGHLVLRGEAIITYSDFDKINEELGEESAKYKNPRNLCSGSVRQLDPSITKKRRVRLVAFALVEKENDGNELKTMQDEFAFLEQLGFEIVYRKLVDKNSILDAIEWYSKDVVENDYPSDGLVLVFNDIAYGKSLGTTAKFPRNAIAFKWKDETAETILTEIEWSPSRTGLINPIAVFKTVELEGTNVSRASLHNISQMEELKLGIGDTIKVYKANMIIPQVLENVTKSSSFIIPTICPSCGGNLAVNENNGVKTLICANVDCPIKHIKSFENFVSRNCMNIDGISIATIEDFLSHGFMKEYADLYKLDRYKDKIVVLEGFGEKSYQNIVKAVDDSRKTECYRVINALGIIGIGTANAKVLSKYYSDDIYSIMGASIDELTKIDDIGPILAKSIYDYFNDEKNKKVIDNLLKEITIVKGSYDTDGLKLKGMTFVITGDLETYANRDELVKVIEDNGGKVSSSVSKKTTYLINNDVNSSSSKNKKAKELGVPIINENKFKEIIL